MRTHAKTWLIVAGLATVVAGGAVGIIVKMRNQPVKPVHPGLASPIEVTKYMASDAFGALPLEQQVQYMDQVRIARDGQPRQSFRELDQQLTEKERDNLRKNMETMRERQDQKQIEDYFKLPEDQRVAYLDKIIDEQQERRRNFESRAATRPSSRPERATQPSSQPRGGTLAQRLDRMRERIETTEPLRRAQQDAFRKALRARMEQRGITGGFGGRGGPGGPGGGRPPG